MPVAVLLLAASYLVGAVPFGYLIGRVKGVDLFKAGSGNIGATNVGRVLGKKWGVLAFALDFLKGAVPVAFVVPLAERLDPSAPDALGHPDALRVLAGLFAFLGHLFPVYLRFRGGKGVATGAGVVAVLVPGPFAVALIVWLSTTLATRYVSAGSILAGFALVAARMLGTPHPFVFPEWIVTAFCFVGAGLVIVRHRGNVKRLLGGTENKIGDGAVRQALLRGVHLVAAGLWFGGGAFFAFVAAVPIFDSFKEVVRNQPSDRTGYVRILPDDAPEEDKTALASGLAGSAVGPVFPRFFALSAVCAAACVVTAEGFRRMKGARVHRLRLWLCLIGLGLVAAGWPLSDLVSRLRVERFHPDAAVAAGAKAAFAQWHLVSLASSGLTTLVAGVVLALAAVLPAGGRTDPKPAA